MSAVSVVAEDKQDAGTQEHGESRDRESERKRRPQNAVAFAAFGDDDVNWNEEYVLRSGCVSSLA